MYVCMYGWMDGCMCVCVCCPLMSLKEGFQDNTEIIFSLSQINSTHI